MKEPFIPAEITAVGIAPRDVIATSIELPLVPLSCDGSADFPGSSETF